MKKIYFFRHCSAIIALGAFFAVTAQAAFTPTEGTKYFLKNVTHDLYLDVGSDAKQAVLVAQNAGSATQKFTFLEDPNRDKIPEAYRIQQVSTEKYLRKSGGNNTTSATQGAAFFTTIDTWLDNFALVIEDSIVDGTVVGYKIQSKIKYASANLGGAQSVEDNRYFCKDASNNNLRSVITGTAPDLWDFEEVVEDVSAARTAYYAAYDLALAVKTELEAIDDDLENLKATSTTDYGKFDAAKIAILQKLGTDYTKDMFDASDDYDAIESTTTELQSLAGLSHQFYCSGDVSLTTGWYRVKMTGNDKYLTYATGFKFLGDTEAEDDYRVMYLNKTANNLDTRFAMYPYFALQTNQTTAFTGGGSFFGVREAGLIEDQPSYILASGGSGNPTISSVNEETGSITYGDISATRDLKYRLLLEPITDLGIPETDLEDGEYFLSFNGTPATGTVSVVEDSVRIDEKSYAITRYGSSESYTYAIGQNDANGYITSEALGTSAPNGKTDAMPRPGFALENVSAVLAAYSAAYEQAVAIKTELEAIDPNLENLKAESDTDYGKFDAAKIAILQKLGTDYTEDMFDESEDYDAIVSATTELESLAGLNSHQFYIGGDADLTTGWYRVKMTGNDKYLTYDAAFKFLEDTEAEDDYRVMYLNKTANNLDTRFAMYPYFALQTNQTTAFTGGGSFFGVREAGLIEDQPSYILASGGSGNPTISSVNEETGSITYGDISATRDLRYRLLLEPITDLGIAETDLEDGEYFLSFNGTPAGKVSVVEDSVRISDIPYAITRYGSSESYTYAIGQNDANGYITSEALGTSAPNGKIDAMPRPGFAFVKTATGITATDANDPVIAVRYFNLQGVEIRQPSQSGVYIVKKIHQSQKEEALKTTIVVR